MSDPQAWDRYAAMNNNPVKFVDPSGRKPCIEDNKNGQCKVDLKIMRLPAYPKDKLGDGNGSWKLIARNGAVSWYDYPIRNDRTIKDPNDLEDQSYLRMQGSVKLNGINYNWVGSRWVQNDLPCEYASSTQCITPYEDKTSTQPVTGAVHIPGQIPQGQNLLILIQIPGAEDDFANGVIVNTRDECPACTPIKVDILTTFPRNHTSYNKDKYEYTVYIWVWVPDSFNP
jgi:hypothetical protein